MSVIRILALFAVLAAALPAAAADDPGPGAESKSEYLAPLGERTRAWLERQREGWDASPRAHGLTPPAERRARKRYLESYEYPIPELFDMDATLGTP